MLPNKHIVIAEDDMDDSFMFKYAFNEICSGVELRVAADGNELMKILVDRALPAAIFLDLDLPQKNGKECLKEIRANDKFRDVPVVMISMSNDKDEIDDCLDNGADEFYEKPESFQGFKDILMKVCDKELKGIDK